MSLFAKPNVDKDQEVLREEKERQSYDKDWSKFYWKPVPKHELRNDREITEEVGVRILMAPGNVEGAHWYVKIAKHIIRHPDGGWEGFTCMKEVYGEDCVACNKYQELVEIAQKEKVKSKKDELWQNANVYRPTRFGFFNVLGVKYTTDNHTRITERAVEEKVKLFQAPISLWTKIVSIHSSRGRSSDFFDEFDEKGNITSPGRDIIIIHDKDQPPANRYNAIPTDHVELGKSEQIQEWISQIKPLTPEDLENVAPKIDADVAQIKTFGSKQEREQLRELLKEIWLENKKKEEEEESESIADAKREVNQQPPKEVKKKTTKKEEVKEEVKEEKPAEPVVEKKKEEEPTPPAGDKMSALKAKLAKIKKDQDK